MAREEIILRGGETLQVVELSPAEAADIIHRLADMLAHSGHAAPSVYLNGDPTGPARKKRLSLVVDHKSKG